MKFVGSDLNMTGIKLLSRCRSFFGHKGAMATIGVSIAELIILMCVHALYILDLCYPCMVALAYNTAIFILTLWSSSHLANIPIRWYIVLHCHLLYQPSTDCDDHMSAPGPEGQGCSISVLVNGCHDVASHT
ncbi:hypothetical protein BD769DRAFT_186471 [Suillus cothurnatus]|nr:hypothetical protein BD769DRAFT_186471 [Suillus cothurnatus]